jgi:choline dehydrogenase-like flavoprotein
LLDWLFEDETSWPSFLSGGFHHMGTTRMHDDPKQGVLDANGKVHGIANLHVAGASMFTTAGAANPTLTILALSIRMADHMKKIW